MKKRVLIASIFSGETLNPMIVKLSPTDIMLIVEKDIEKLSGKDIQEKKQAIETLKKNFGNILKIGFIEVKNIYDLYETAKETIKAIDDNKNAEIILNISEGRKPISFGMSFAAYLRKDTVNSIYYLVKETNELLRMPILNFLVNNVQKEILIELSKKSWETTPLREKIKKSKSVFYKYINNLLTNGYIKEDDKRLNITELGKIMIL